MRKKIIPPIQFLTVILMVIAVCYSAASAQSKIYTDAERERMAQEAAAAYIAEFVPQGRAAYNAKNYREAVGRMTQVLIVDPHNFDGLIIRGLALKELNFLAEAERDLRQGAMDHPGSWAMNYQLGVMLLNLGKPAEAAPYLKKHTAQVLAVGKLLGGLLLSRSR